MTENNHTESHELLTKQVADLTRKLDAIKNVLCQAKEILTLEEAAIFLGISKSCLYKMTHNQVVPFFKPNNELVYFERSELIKWIRSCRVASMDQIESEAARIERVLALK